MAKSIKYTEADTYHDAGNVYDNTQHKTQEEINASMNVSDVVTFTEKDYTVTYCRSGNVVTVVAYRNSVPTVDVDVALSQKLPFIPYVGATIAVNSYAFNENFMAISVSGVIRIVHKKATGWYQCCATYIAKDL